MRRYGNLWDEFISRENFELALVRSQVGKKNRRAVIEFNKDRDANLEAIHQSVINGEFHTGIYVSKIIYEPKERIIYKLPYAPDRIVQHAVINVLKKIFIKRFIHNTFSCIDGRGQHRASDLCRKFVRKYKYCLKCDVRKFYPSIDQAVLMDLLWRLIKDERFLSVVGDIVFSFPGGKNCPIGNLSSQWFGNFYLSFLDNFVYHSLKCHAYIRYCDDFMLFSDDKFFLNSCAVSIKGFLSSRLKLVLSKCNLFSVRQGVDFCGYRCFRDHTLIRKSIKLRIRRRFVRIENNLCSDNPPVHKMAGQIASANGVLIRADSDSFRHSIHFHSIKKSIDCLLCA